LRAEKPAQVAGFISEWWPASNRYGGRDQVGISGRIESEIAVMAQGCGVSSGPSRLELEEEVTYR